MAYGYHDESLTIDQLMKHQNMILMSRSCKPLVCFLGHFLCYHNIEVVVKLVKGLVENKLGLIHGWKMGC